MAAVDARVDHGDLDGASCGGVGQNDHASSSSGTTRFAAYGSVLSNAERDGRQISSGEQRAARASARFTAPGTCAERPGGEAVARRAADPVGARLGRAPPNVQAPAASAVVDETTVQAVPACRCSCTAAPAIAGRSVPCTPATPAGPRPAPQRRPSRGPARTVCQLSRYCVAAAGLTIGRERAVAVEDQVAGGRPVCVAPLRFERTASAPRAKPVSETLPPKVTVFA